MTIARIARAVVCALLISIGALPFVLGFPVIVGESNVNISAALFWTILIVAFLALLVAMFGSDRFQRQLIARLTLFAVVSLIAGQAMRLNRDFALLRLPIPHVLGPLLHVQGESSFDAAEFELYCEYWVGTAIFALGVRGVARALVRWRKPADAGLGKQKT